MSALPSFRMKRNGYFGSKEIGPITRATLEQGNRQEQTLERLNEPKEGWLSIKANKTFKFITFPLSSVLPLVL